jgi:hypothetical protein
LPVFRRFHNGAGTRFQTSDSRRSLSDPTHYVVGFMFCTAVVRKFDSRLGRANPLDEENQRYELVKTAENPDEQNDRDRNPDEP